MWWPWVFVDRSCFWINRGKCHSRRCTFFSVHLCFCFKGVVCGKHSFFAVAFHLYVCLPFFLLMPPCFPFTLSHAMWVMYALLWAAIRGNRGLMCFLSCTFVNVSRYLVESWLYSSSVLKKGTGIGAVQQCCFFLLLSGIVSAEILQPHFYHASFVHQTLINLP